MRPVNREHSVKMVDLVLQQFGAVALELGFVRLSAKVVIAHPDAVGAKHAHQEVGEGEAVVPHGEVFLTDVHDLGIHENPRLFHLDVDEAERRADLRCGDTAPAAEARLPVAQRVGHVVHHHAHGGRLRVGDELTSLSQHRIAKKADSTDGHGAKVGPVQPTVNYPARWSGHGRRRIALQDNGLRSFHRLMAVPTVLLVAGLGACSDSTGGSTPTSAITPTFSVSAAPNSITFAFGRLEATGFASVRLPDDDALVVSAAGQVKTMGWTVEPLGGGQYAASLTQLDPGTVVTFGLNRQDDESAPNSQVTMPQVVNLTAPLEGAVTTAGTNLLVTWSPSGTTDAMTVILRTAVCDRPGAGYTLTTAIEGDPGSATVYVDPGLLPPLASGELCEVDVQVQRVSNGTVDPAYAAGGIIQARQLDAVRILVLQP